MGDASEHTFRAKLLGQNSGVGGINVGANPVLTRAWSNSGRSREKTQEMQGGLMGQTMSAADLEEESDAEKTDVPDRRGQVLGGLWRDKPLPSRSSDMWKTFTDKEPLATLKASQESGRQSGSRGAQLGLDSRQAEVDWAKRISWDVLAEEMVTMQEALTEEEEVSQSRDRVVTWVQDTMEHRLGVQVNQVTALSRCEFLIVFHSEDDRDEVLLNPPGYLDGKVVRIVEWERRHSIKISAHMKPATGGRHLDLPKFVGIKTPWGKTYLQPVVYTRLPDRCFICLGQGHWAWSCPKKRQGVEQTVGKDHGGVEGKTKVAEGSGDHIVHSSDNVELDGFTKVRSKTQGKETSGGGSKSEDGKCQSTNQFEALKDLIAKDAKLNQKDDLMEEVTSKEATVAGETESAKKLQIPRQGRAWEDAVITRPFQALESTMPYQELLRKVEESKVTKKNKQGEMKSLTKLLEANFKKKMSRSQNSADPQPREATQPGAAELI
ncbi:hypothetical protein R1sor_018525 [Riccia sorocarpa]|uniref:CCHC-type domain-containing protein n=1 Tax=Riccia sorocarpa TaxID=122646 RepID=A0ABD3IA13_9MARC